MTKEKSKYTSYITTKERLTKEKKRRKNATRLPEEKKGRQII